jgi:HlyD family secretion protein
LFVIHMLRRILVLLLLALGVAAGVWYYRRPPTALVLTGIVTTHEIIVSPQIGGRIDKLLVDEGDTVHKDQIVAVLALDELRQEREFYNYTAAGIGVQVQESEAALRLEQRQMREEIAQAEATLAATESQRMAADAELDNARVALERAQRMTNDGLGTAEKLDQTRTAYDVARSRVSALIKQMDAQRAAVELARSNAEQVAVRQSQVAATRQQHAAADAQRAKADVRLAYAEIHAPINGFVDVRAARPGEVVNPGQAVVTLIDPDDLWIRADVEETYIDRIAIGTHLTVRLPSGEERQGKVFYRGADAGFATQRDVSRTKRDIRTFEVRLRVDNADRKLAVGMTAYVVLPVQ